MKVCYKLNGRDVSEQEFVAATSPERLHTMLASGRTPGIMSDAVFLEGRCNGSQFQDNPLLGDFYAGEAKKGGVDPKGKVYLSGLAAYPGDPQAWVSGRGDVQKVLEQRGWESQGAVNVKMDQDKVATPTGGGVAADIVAQEAADLVAESGLPLAEAAEKVYENRKPDWVK